MKKNFSLLFHPAFIISILLLLINDIFLKYTFPGWLTGKLSDFTGLFAFAVFLFSFFPARRKAVLIFCGLFFIWWKSFLSQSFIEGFNNISPFAIGRTIDYTDLAALVVLPVTYFFSYSSFSPRLQSRVAINVACFLSLFAFCNTSAPRYGMHYVGQDNSEFYGSFRSAKSENELLDKLRSLNIEFYRDSIIYYPLSKTFRETQRYSYRDSSNQWTLVLNKKDSSLFYKQKEEPFYIIPEYQIEGKTVRNVKLRIRPRYNTKKKEIVIDVNLIHQFAYSMRDDAKLKRLYKKHFKELFN